MRQTFKSFLTESSWPKNEGEVWKRLNKYYDVLSGIYTVYDLSEDDVTIHPDMSVTIDLHSDERFFRLKKTKEQLPNLMVKFKKFNCSFTCSHVDTLMSLEGAPDEVTGNFDCYESGIKTLKDGPKKVGGYYNLTGAQITKLEGLPVDKVSSLSVSRTNIRNLVGAPEVVDTLKAQQCHWLTSLTGLPKIIKFLELEYTPHMGLLRLPLSKIADIKLIKPDQAINIKLWNQIYKAVDDTLNEGRIGVLELQKRLLDLDLEKNARM